MESWPVNVPQSNGSASADPRDDLAPAVGNGAILAAIQAVEAKLQAVEAKLQAVQASTRNGRRRELIRIGGVWTPILVERAGPNPIGAVPPSHPASHEAALDMTGPQITALEGEFNLPPGTFNGDTIFARREAVFRYLREG